MAGTVTTAELRELAEVYSERGRHVETTHHDSLDKEQGRHEQFVGRELRKLADRIDSAWEEH